MIKFPIKIAFHEGKNQTAREGSFDDWDIDLSKLRGRHMSEKYIYMAQYSCIKQE